MMSKFLFSIGLVVALAVGSPPVRAESGLGRLLRC